MWLCVYFYTFFTHCGGIFYVLPEINALSHRPARSLQSAGSTFPLQKRSPSAFAATANVAMANITETLNIIFVQCSRLPADSDDSLRLKFAIADVADESPSLFLMSHNKFSTSAKNKNRGIKC